MSIPRSIHDCPVSMTPQVSPKDVPQDSEGSEVEEEPPPVVSFGGESSGSSSEDDDDGEASQGYVPLSMDDGTEAPEGYIYESENDYITTPEEVASPTLLESTSTSVVNSTVASTSTSSSTDSTSSLTDEQLDNDQVDLIRQVMSNITLPSSAVPDWAKVIPEEKWKTTLFTSMHKQTDDDSLDEHPEQ